MSTRSIVQAESTEPFVLQVPSGALQDLGMRMWWQAGVAWLGKKAAMPAVVFSFLPLHDYTLACLVLRVNCIGSCSLQGGLTIANHLPLF